MVNYPGVGTGFRTTRDAAYELGRVGEGALKGRLTHLPFNRFDNVDDTTWWLSPSADVPAYKYGKIAFTRTYFEPEMFIGLYVEKGLDPKFAETAYPSRQYGLDADWLWPTFVGALKSGALADTIGTMERKCNRPVTVALDGGTPGGDWDFVRFNHYQRLLSVERQAAGTLMPLSQATSLLELSNAIEGLPGLGWLWIDFHVGLTFSDSSDDTWDAQTIWTRVCAPWKDWLR